MEYVLSDIKLARSFDNIAVDGKLSQIKNTRRNTLRYTRQQHRYPFSPTFSPSLQVAESLTYVFNGLFIFHIYLFDTPHPFQIKRLRPAVELLSKNGLFTSNPPAMLFHVFSGGLCSRRLQHRNPHFPPAGSYELLWLALALRSFPHTYTLALILTAYPRRVKDGCVY